MLVAIIFFTGVSACISSTAGRRRQRAITSTPAVRSGSASSAPV